MTFYADRLSTGFMLQLYVDRKQIAIVLGRLRLTWVRSCIYGTPVSYKVR